MDETDTLHVLSCPHKLFTQHKNEVVSELQLKVLGLLEGDMFPLCFLEWMLDDSYDDIDDLPESVMASLRQVSRRNVWYGFLHACFHRWILWRCESTKWLVKHIAICIEALHTLWLERCKIVHEYMLSKVRVEDHCNLLNQVKQLYL